MIMSRGIKQEKTMKHMRVSEILARLQNFSAIDQAILSAKAEIGTNVHKAITQSAQGQTISDLTQREMAYYDSYDLFRNEYNPTYIMLEARFNDDNLMITGEIDALAKIGDDLVILDWKTSSSANKKIWEMQAHFYWYLLNGNKIPVGNKMLWVHLRQDKVFTLDEDGNRVLDWTGQPEYQYQSKKPKVYEFNWNSKVLSECIQEAEKAWDEKKDRFDID